MHARKTTDLELGRVRYLELTFSPAPILAIARSRRPPHRVDA